MFGRSIPNKSLEGLRGYNNWTPHDGKAPDYPRDTLFHLYLSNGTYLAFVPYTQIEWVLKTDDVFSVEFYYASTLKEAVYDFQWANTMLPVQQLADSRCLIAVKEKPTTSNQQIVGPIREFSWPNSQPPLGRVRNKYPLYSYSYIEGGIQIPLWVDTQATCTS
jgi:hypothetical protein